MIGIQYLAIPFNKVLSNQGQNQTMGFSELDCNTKIDSEIQLKVKKLVKEYQK